MSFNHYYAGNSDQSDDRGETPFAKLKGENEKNLC